MQILDKAAAWAPIVAVLGFLGLAWANILRAFGASCPDAYAWGALATLLAAGFIGIFHSHTTED